MSEIDVSKCEYCYTVSGQPLCMIGANDTRYNDECIDNPNCYYKQLQQLKAENEELNRKLKIAYTAEAFVKTQKEYTNLDKYKQCIDEIEEICKECHKHDYDLCCICKYADNCRTDDGYTSYDVADYIHSIIKQAKEGRE